MTINLSASNFRDNHVADNYVVSGRSMKHLYTSDGSCMYSFINIRKYGGLQDGIIVINSTIDISDEYCENIYVSVLG